MFFLTWACIKTQPNQTNLFTALKDFLANFRCLSVFTGGGPTTSLPPEDFGIFPDVLNLRITVYHLKSDGGHPTKQKTGNFIFKTYSCRKQNRETKEMRLLLDTH